MIDYNPSHILSVSNVMFFSGDSVIKQDKDTMLLCWRIYF